MFVNLLKGNLLTILTETWKIHLDFVTMCTFLKTRNGSSGVFIDGKLVAGALQNGSGMISMLNTLPSFRHKGYAQLCMDYFVQYLLKDNLIPCCTVEMSNTASLALQRKIGLKPSHEAFYITRS